MNTRSKHGHRSIKPTRTYTKWCSMLARCLRPTRKDYKYYGAIGITVCERWMKFENFLADMGEAPAGLTLDRINGALGYSPENCRWITQRQQNANKKGVLSATYQGRTQTLIDWARELGLSSTARIKDRLRSGWSLDKALSTPSRVRKARVDHLRLAITKAESLS